MFDPDPREGIMPDSPDDIVQRILTNVRWDYGPPTDVEKVDP